MPHDHAHAGHSHHGQSRAHAHGELGGSRLGWSLAVNLLLTLFEAAAGVLAGSLALLADALHNLSDCASLLVAYIARRVARRAPDRRYTFGYRRAELIGAMINLTALVVLGGYLILEAAGRFLAPRPVDGALVVAAGGVALAVDAVTAGLLWRMARGSLNVRAAFVHNLSDAFSSVVVVAGGLAVMAWGVSFVDPLLTLLIAAYVIVHAVSMLRRTAHILMMGSGGQVDLDALARRMIQIRHVVDVHHVHVWNLDENHLAMDAHVAIDRANVLAMEEIKQELKTLLEKEYGFASTTLEFEFALEEGQEPWHDMSLIVPHR